VTEVAEIANVVTVGVGVGVVPKAAGEIIDNIMRKKNPRAR
jgi:hypothetical protein